MRASRSWHLPLSPTLAEGGVGEGGGCHERDAFSLLQLLARTQKKKLIRIYMKQFMDRERPQ